VYAGSDNIPYVYTKNRTRQVIVPGEANEKNIIIEKGLAEGTLVYLSRPEDYSKFTLANIDLSGEFNQSKPDRLTDNALSLSGEKGKNEAVIIKMFRMLTGSLI
ncbi:MAG: hypothetical protein HPY62_02815, partial [Bacteroidales bacterium]|nr:hypothetical protein [Bacteroidales bacterium]